METRAHHLLIGLFVIMAIIGFFMFSIWITKGEIGKSYTEYEIVFCESITGLGTSADVMFNGIPVGKVTEIDIVEEDLSAVKVTVRVENQNDPNFYKNTHAVLSSVGLTGIAFVQLVGGGHDDDQSNTCPVITSIAIGPNVIQADTSPFHQLMSNVPELLGGLGDIAESLEKLLDEENQNNVKRILVNADKAIAAIADQSEKFDDLIDKILAAIKDIKTLAGSAQGVMVKIDKAMDEDIKKIFNSASDLMDKLNTLVADNKQAITSFSNEALPEMSLLISDARRLAEALTYLAEQLESDPASIIFARPKPEFEPEQ